ncbi:MAG: hypothetical protein JOZ08_11880, partial [Verrucomicrobia bacterium]|nr:hypothetical protein [Verrucomicrobiota bacterium]
TYPYTVKVIPGRAPAYETEFQPVAIADKGKIAGADSIPNVSDAHAFLWSQGTVVIATSINNLDEITVYLYNEKSEVNAIGILEPSR